MTPAVHYCTAHGCTARVPRSHYFCLPHWYALPWNLREEILKLYKHGAGLQLTTALREARRLLARHDDAFVRMG